MEESPGKRLRLVRSYLSKKLGMKINSEDMAEITHVSQSTYYRFERGLQPITVDALKELYRKYKILPNYVCLGILPMVEDEHYKQTLITDITDIKSDILSLKAMVKMIARNKKHTGDIIKHSPPL